MKRFTSIAGSILLVLSAGSIVVPQSPDRLEKIAEGECWQWENGHPVKDTTQGWTIWRTKDGFEVESTLPADQGALWLAAIGRGGLPASSELREEARNTAMPTEFHMQLDQSMGVSALRVNGKSLADGKTVVVANCVAKPTEISCKGRLGTAHVKNLVQSQLSYSYASPLLYMPLLKRAKLEPGQTVPIKLVMLEEVKGKTQLSDTSGQLRNEGPDKLSIGDHTFEGERLSLSLETKAGPRQITLWASTGIYFWDEGFAPDAGF